MADDQLEEDELELPPVDAPLVEQPFPLELLNGQGVPENMDTFLALCSWNIRLDRPVVDKRPNRDGDIYWWDWLVDWTPTWHTQAMITALEGAGWVAEVVDMDNPRVTRYEGYEWVEYRVTWPRGRAKFEEFSPHYQAVLESQG